MNVCKNAYIQQAQNGGQLRMHNSPTLDKSHAVLMEYLVLICIVAFLLKTYP